MSEREEYLDELLKEMGNHSEEQTTEESILNNFDKELEGIDEDSFLREFEESLGDDLDFDSELGFSEEPITKKESAGMEEPDNSDAADFMNNIDDIVNNVKNGSLEDGLGDGDLSIEESLKNLDEKDPDLDKIGQEFALDDSFMMNTLEPEQAESEEPAEELSREEQLAREIEGLHLEQDEEKVSGDSQQKHSATEQEAEQKSQDKPEKKGFFSRLSVLLFGEEEEDTAKTALPVNAKDMENMSAEELEALKQLEEQNAAAFSEEAEKKAKEKEEKKALKEQKAKEKAEKKAEKKAVKEQKAREKAEKRALEKSREPVVKSKPLPKKPVVLIMLFGISIVILVNLVSSLSGYTAALADAKNYYDKGEYVAAYGCLSEKDIKEKDTAFYDKVKYMSYLQQQLESYEAYQSQKMYDEALAALIGGVGRYDRFMEEAGKAGVKRGYKKMLRTIEEKLKSEYKMSVEQAREIYALDDKKEFTYAVGEVIDELGLREEL